MSGSCQTGAGSGPASLTASAGRPPPPPPPSATTNARCGPPATSWSRARAAGRQSGTSPGGKYPTSRGALSTQVVHFARDLADAHLNLEPKEGRILVRSTDELALYIAPCLVEMEGPLYTARGEEHAVMGSQFPVFVSDSREARRGTLVLLTRNLGAVQRPAAHRLPGVGADPARSCCRGAGTRRCCCDDLRCLPLDVEVEQTTAIGRGRPVRPHRLHRDRPQRAAGGALGRQRLDGDAAHRAVHHQRRHPGPGPVGDAHQHVHRALR